MGRGSDHQRDISQAQLAQTNQQIATATGRLNEQNSLLMPAISGLMNSNGYSDTEKGAMTKNAMEAGDEASDAGAQQAKAAAARTHNSAGLFSALTANAQKRGQQKSDTAAGLQTNFANEKERRRETGTDALAKMYGINTSLVGSLNGAANGNLGNNAAGIGKYNYGFGPFSMGGG